MDGVIEGLEFELKGVREASPVVENKKNDEEGKRRHLPNSEGWSQKQNQSWTGEHHSGNSSSWRVSPMIDDRKGWLD